jgi:hypothetical protein
MIGGAAGGLALPKWRLPDPVIILPTATATADLYANYTCVNYALGYTVTKEELADNLYTHGFGLAPVKSEGGIILYDPEFEDILK